MIDQSELEHRLQAGMAALAEGVAPSEPLAERILAGTDEARAGARPTRRVVNRWVVNRWVVNRWVVPLAAALVAAVLLAGSVVGVRALRSAPAPTVAPVASIPPNLASIAPPRPTVGPSPSVPAFDSKRVPFQFRATDVSFVDASEGWALGTWPCSVVACSALVHTTNGGAIWRQVRTQSGLPPELTRVAFATSEIGYAWVPKGALLMTTDGGVRWRQAAEQVDAFATGGGRAFLLRSPAPPCSRICAPTLSTAPIGSAAWRAQDFSGALESPGSTSDGAYRAADADISVSGKTVVALLGNRTVTEALVGPHRVVVSDDGGVTWTYHGEPCPKSGDTVGALGVASDRTVAVGCGSSIYASVVRHGFALVWGGSVPPITSVLAYNSNEFLVYARGFYAVTSASAPRSSATQGARPSTAAVLQQLGPDGAVVLDATAQLPSRLWTSQDAGETWTSLTID